MKKLIVLAFCIGTALAVYVYYRNEVMGRLFAEAAGQAPFFNSSAESEIAVSKLAGYWGDQSIELLLTLALQHSTAAPEVQIKAVKALQARGDSNVAVLLAGLVQPHEGLELRKAVAGALRDLPCTSDCIRSCLHYLERVWRGQPNYEDSLMGSDAVTAAIKADQGALYSSLYAVLRREKRAALELLVKVYGLGTTSPDMFAIDLVTRLGLLEACPYLLESDRQVRIISPEFRTAPREQLNSAIASLKCR